MPTPTPTRTPTRTPSPAPGAAKFYTLPPCRVLDTRTANGPFGGPALQPSQERLFTVTARCGIPASALSISVNATVVPAAAGFFVLYPGNASTPGTSNLNFRAGQVRANSAVVRLATDGSGSIAVRNSSTGANHFVLDVNGYFQ